MPNALTAASPTPTASPTGMQLAASTNLTSSAKIQPAAPAVHVNGENNLWKARFGSVGGTLEELTLEKYHEAVDPKSAPVSLLPFRGAAPNPLQWSFQSATGTLEDAGASYKVVEESAQKIAFEREAEGLRIRKVFEWEVDSYLIEETVIVTNVSGGPLKISPSTKMYSGAHEIKGRGMGARGDVMRVSTRLNDKTVYFPPPQILKANSPEKKVELVPGGTDISWAGFDSHYFLLAALPVEGRWETLHLDEEHSVDEKGNPIVDHVAVSLLYPSLDLAPKGQQQYRLKLFAGPKDIGVLQSAGASLDRAIDLGDWLGPIARPILYFLRWLYHHTVANYGVAIILLTVLVRLLLFPLTQMQSRSMIKMQKHKPELDAIKEKYKDDREAHSREMMNYMRKHRVNPMGGCLLLLPQMPVLFALYRVLYNAIEIRHAPFFLWIHDLSAHDPYFVLPALLGISMFLQQQMTPNPSADPAQQTMMKVMPIMFTGFMIFLPAGLNLYIFVSTIWGVAQQYWMKRKMEAAGVGPLPVKTA